MKIEIPPYVIEIINQLESSGYEAFIVGGCVRDILLDREPKDWDVATNAKPSDIIKLFPDSVYENDFGTVGIKIKREATSDKQQEDEITEIIEITTYRIESKYTDKRHPDEIQFAKTLAEDLSRRDFTINAMAIHLETQNVKSDFPVSNYEIIDPFDGQKDLKNKVIRAVGKANERFNEDALRMMRAVRFVVTLGDSDKRQETNDGEQGTWNMEKKTFEAIKKNAKNLEYISEERIKDELEKIILSSQPAKGIEFLHETKLLKYIIPEIEAGYAVTQSHHHYHGPYNTVYKHLVASLEKCPSQKLEVRLAALFHDIGKPKSKRGRGETATFYNHEYIGSKMAQEVLERLRFSRRVIDKVVLLVKNHMFYYNVDEVGEAGVRRVIRKVGLENINDLIDVRIADRLGSGVPKAVPYKLRHFKFMVERVSRDAVSVKQLKINGHDLMKEIHIEAGPKVGAVLDLLLAQVIDEPALNERKKLLAIAKKLKDKNLDNLRLLAKEKIDQEKKEEEKVMKKKYWVE